MATTSTINSSMDLLWTNPNPTSSFAPQAISVPKLFEYSILLIEFTGELTDDYRVTFCSVFFNILANNLHCLSAVYPTRSADIVTTNTRLFQCFSNNTISFGDGIYDNSSGHGYNNICAVPYKIYGIK